MEAVSTLVRKNFDHLYREKTKKTLIGLYSKRYGADHKDAGQPYETVTDIVYRVATSIALAELKYSLTVEQILDISLEDAIKHPKVIEWAEKFADCIGNQKFWANTPANINADPAVSLAVLKYEAHGKDAGLELEEIWRRSEEFEKFYLQNRLRAGVDPEYYYEGDYMYQMGKLAHELKGKGTLAACGVTAVEDTLLGILDAARNMVMAAKNSMGMGVNTSTLRPWSSVVANGAAASGPDRFYEKALSSSVKSVAQGGRRGGALIEIRNSDHPDILFFIDKKKLIPPPNFTRILQNIQKQHPTQSLEGQFEAALQEFGAKSAEYSERQNYLLNTNISVLCMPGFMEAVKAKRFYPATFDGEAWAGKLYDPRRPIFDSETGAQAISTVTKELLFEEYTVDISEFPEAMLAASFLNGSYIGREANRVKIKGHFYAPDVFKRIVMGMCESGEPGLQFYETINAGNANDHEYDLNTTNPCSEQSLPCGISTSGQTLMGVCNLSSMHAAHSSFWNKGQYNFKEMEAVTEIQMRYMDNSVDLSWFAIPAQNVTSRLERRTGGGFTGLAEFISRRGVEFGSARAHEIVEELFRKYTKACVKASMDLAAERGTYPMWNGSRWEKRGLKVRNTCMTNVAPSGSLSQFMQTTFGCDSHYGIAYTRKVRGVDVEFVAPGFEEAMKKYGAWPETEEAQRDLLYRQINDNHKSCRGLASVPAEVQEIFPIKTEVEPEGYIRHLAAIHAAADEYPEAFNSISNTCHIPLGYSHEKVAYAVMLAFELNVKAITFYPDKARRSQPTEGIAAEGYDTESKDLFTLLGHKPRRAINIEETAGETYKIKVGAANGTQTLHCILNHERNRPGQLVELYVSLGKAGTVENGLLEAIGRLASSFLQYAAEHGEADRDIAEQTIIKQLSGIETGAVAYHKFGGDEKAVVITSPCDGLARAIKQYRQKQFHAKIFSPTEIDKSLYAPINFLTLEQIASQHSVKVCPSCRQPGTLEKIDGCDTCQCGYSKCG